MLFWFQGENDCPFGSHHDTRFRFAQITSINLSAVKGENTVKLHQLHRSLPFDLDKLKLSSRITCHAYKLKLKSAFTAVILPHSRAMNRSEHIEKKVIVCVFSIQTNSKPDSLMVIKFYN